MNGKKRQAETGWQENFQLILLEKVHSEAICAAAGG